MEIFLEAIGYNVTLLMAANLDDVEKFAQGRFHEVLVNAEMSHKVDMISEPPVRDRDP